MHQMQLGKIKVSFTQVRCPLARAWGATGGGKRLEMKGDQTQGVKSRGIVGAGGSAVMQTVESLVSELFDMIGCGEAR